MNFYQTRYNNRNMLSESDIAVIKALTVSLDRVLKTFPDGAFVRLSSRSPKDGSPLCFDFEKDFAFHSKRIRESVKEEEAKTEAESEAVEIDIKMRILCACTPLRCRSGKDAINLILSSERVFVDLNEALTCHKAFSSANSRSSFSTSSLAANSPVSPSTDYSASTSTTTSSSSPNATTTVLAIDNNGNNNSNNSNNNSNTLSPSGLVIPSWTTQISIRKWETELDGEMEFRCFVYEGKLTAISQYNHYILVPSIRAHQDELFPLLVAFWETEVAPRLKEYSNYIVDLAVIGTRCLVVELNPFAVTTGAALFSWKWDADLLHHGPVCLRVREESMANLDGLVELMTSDLKSLKSEVSFEEYLKMRTANSAVGTKHAACLLC